MSFWFSLVSFILLMLIPWFSYCKNIFPVLYLQTSCIMPYRCMIIGISEFVNKHRENGILWFVRELWTGPKIPACFHVFFCYKIICTKTLNNFDSDDLGTLEVWHVLLSFIYLTEITSVASGCENTCHQASIISYLGSFPLKHMSSVESSLPWTSLLYGQYM